MRTSIRSRCVRLLLAAGLVALAAPLFAQPAQPRKPCSSGTDGDRARHCELRTMTVPAAGDLAVDASPNGGISVRGSNRSDVEVQARVNAQADTLEQAKALVAQVRVLTDGGRIRAEGPPRTDTGASWSVSFDIMVPSQGNLDLTSKNGGISIEDVQGRLTFKTTNGGIQLKNVNGDVRGKTSNGGVSVQLEGGGWYGEGLDVETTNGGVRLSVPEAYSAHVEASTNMGGVHSDFPVTTDAHGGRTLNTDLGSGGSPIRLRTVNGGVSVQKR